jgi:hypothetical protein
VSSAQGKLQRDVEHPFAIEANNNDMGGVDRMDQNISN